MRIQLSSHLSFLYRGVFPLLPIVGAAATIPLALERSDGSIPLAVAINLAIWVPYTLFVIWFTGRLRTVWLAGSNLVVDGPEGNRSIPLRQVARVSETRFWNPKMISIYVRAADGAEERIVFLAPWDVQFPLSDHSVVRLLRRRVAEVRADADRVHTGV